MSDSVQEPSGSPSSRRDHAGMPRWVKVLLFVLAAAVAILVLTQLLGIGGGHGPGRHGAVLSTTQGGSA
jgi:hypothetical protein